MSKRLRGFGSALLCCSIQLPSAAGAIQQERSMEQMLSDYSRCIISVTPQEAADFVLSAEVLGGRGSTRAKGPTSKRCAYAFAGNDDVRFIPSWYRDELAVPLVGEEFASQGPSSFEHKEALVHPPLPVAGDRQYVYQKLEYDNSRLGECVARSAPEEVRMWIIASGATAGDKPSAEIDKVRRTCARALAADFFGDQTRGPIARGYYRLAHAPSTAAAAR